MTTTHEPIGRRAPAPQTVVTVPATDLRYWFLIRDSSRTVHTARPISHGSPRTLCGQIILAAQRRPAPGNAPRCRSCSRIVDGTW